MLRSSSPSNDGALDIRSYLLTTWLDIVVVLDGWTSGHHLWSQMLTGHLTLKVTGLQLWMFTVIDAKNGPWIEHCFFSFWFVHRFNTEGIIDAFSRTIKFLFSCLRHVNHFVLYLIHTPFVLALIHTSTSHSFCLSSKSLVYFTLLLS